MKKNFFLIMVVSALLYSCSGNSDKAKDVDTSDTTITYAEPGKTVYEKYGLKSAVIHLKSTTMGLEQNIIMYFDDYGKKQSTELTQELFGQKMKQFTITDSGYIYSYNTVDNNGTKVKVNENDPDNINFNAITEKMAKQFNIKKTGIATIIGKKCDVYSMEFAASKMKGTYYIYKGFMLKTESSVSGITIKMEATKFDENPVIPAEKFTIPKNINFKLVDKSEDMAKNS